MRMNVYLIMYLLFAPIVASCSDTEISQQISAIEEGGFGAPWDDFVVKVSEGGGVSATDLILECRPHAWYPGYELCCLTTDTGSYGCCAACYRGGCGSVHCGDNPWLGW